MKLELITSALVLSMAAPAWAQDSVKVKGGNTSVKVENGKVDIQALTVGGDDEPEEAAAEPEAPTEDAQAAELDLLISGNARKMTHACTPKKDDISISGNANQITLTGNCRNVLVTGNANKVSVEGVVVLTVTGNANQVSWVSGPDGKDPKITQSGNANQVKKLKPKT